MPRGSKPGERRGGRRRGTPNKATVAKAAALEAASANPNITPLEFLLGKPSQWLTRLLRLLSSNPGRSGARALGLLPASAAFPLAGERTAKTRLCVTFNGMITGHLGMMPLSYNGDGIYKSIIDGTKAKIKPLPKGLK